MADPFTVEVVARSYEIDSNRHVAGVVLLQYAQHARWECMSQAGISASACAQVGLAPGSLEERIAFRRELLAGEAVEISCEFRWSTGKSFTVAQELRHSDGGLIAEVENVGGLMDLEQRRLVSDPGGRFAEIASSPALLGL
ncbi:MAG: acyl-CoA thioesterase [Actinobacteria bacterium]|nr:acyl-CoA thioesterase [Actinomycetota bacterium]